MSPLNKLKAVFSFKLVNNWVYCPQTDFKKSMANHNDRTVKQYKTSTSCLLQITIHNNSINIYVRCRCCLTFTTGQNTFIGYVGMVQDILTNETKPWDYIYPLSVIIVKQRQKMWLTTFIVSFYDKKKITIAITSH